MIDSIRETKNILNVGMSFECKFYRKKIMLFLVSYFRSIIFTVLSAELIKNNPDNYSSYFAKNLSRDPMVLGMLLTRLIWLICGVFFVFCLVLSIWSANKELGKLPYLETRERQLSLRLFKHHTAILILFLVGFETYIVFFETQQSVVSLVDTRETHLETLLLVSIYAYTVAFIYLPSTQRDIRELRHEFQSYLSPRDTPQQDIKWNLMNLYHYSLQLLDFLIESQHDVQLIICHGKIWSKFSKNKRELKRFNTLVGGPSKDGNASDIDTVLSITNAIAHSKYNDSKRQETNVGQEQK